MTNTHTHTTKIKLKKDSFADFFALVKKYAEDKWKLKSYYIRNFVKQGVILENDDGGEVEIWTKEVFEGKEKNAAELVSNNIEKIVGLFPNKHNKEEHEKRKDKEKMEEAKKTKSFIFTFQGVSNFEELKEKVRIFYQKHQAKIKQNRNFANWIEISGEGFWNSPEKKDYFCIYLGKKRKNLNFNKKKFSGWLIMKECFGKIAAYRKTKFVYSIKKEGNENLPKQLENYWNDLVKENKSNLLKNLEKVKNWEEQEKKADNKNSKLITGLVLACTLTTLLIGMVVYFCFRKKKAN